MSAGLGEHEHEFVRSDNTGRELTAARFDVGHESLRGALAEFSLERAIPDRQHVRALGVAVNTPVDGDVLADKRLLDSFEELAILASVVGLDMRQSDLRLAQLPMICSEEYYFPLGILDLLQVAS